MEERPGMYRLRRNLSQATGREGTRKLRLSSEPPADKPALPEPPWWPERRLGAQIESWGRLVSGTVVITMS